MAQLLDGRQLAQKRVESLQARIRAVQLRRGAPPKLAVILVGDNPESQTYVKFKTVRCESLGIISERHLLPDIILQNDLLNLIHSLNQDQSVDGILLQLPLPKHLDPQGAIDAISPEKDVDGLHPFNQGLLFQNRPTFIPCTPKGCLDLILSCCGSVKGKRVVIVGRSILVGRPLGALLLNQDATVTITHSQTVDLETICREADILISAVGRPHLISAKFVKNGAIVIDVGQTHVDNQIMGDVHFESVNPQASYLTPTIGGVGPMTIINLMENVIYAAEQRIPK